VPLKRNLTIAKTTGLIFFAVQHRFSLRSAFWHNTAVVQYILNGLTSTLLSSLLTAESVDLVVAPFHDEIVLKFHSGYFDCRGSFLIHTAV